MAIGSTSRGTHQRDPRTRRERSSIRCAQAKTCAGTRRGGLVRGQNVLSITYKPPTRYGPTHTSVDPAEKWHKRCGRRAPYLIDRYGRIRPSTLLRTPNYTYARHHGSRSRTRRAFTAITAYTSERNMRVTCVFICKAKRAPLALEREGPMPEHGTTCSCLCRLEATRRSLHANRPAAIRVAAKYAARRRRWYRHVTRVAACVISHQGCALMP